MNRLERAVSFCGILAPEKACTFHPRLSLVENVLTSIKSITKPVEKPVQISVVLAQLPDFID